MNHHDPLVRPAISLGLAVFGVGPLGIPMKIWGGKSKSARQMEVKITAHHKGHFEFSICISEQSRVLFGVFF